MRIEQLRQRLRDLGAKPCHEQRVLRAWSQVKSMDTRRRLAEDFLPLDLRAALPVIMVGRHRVRLIEWLRSQ